MIHTFSSVLLISLFIFSFSAFAESDMMRERRIMRNSNVSAPSTEPEIVTWVGEVKDDPSTHTTEHEHELKFVRKEDGKEFEIKDSPDLVKFHHEAEKNFIAEVEAEKTPRFLFWGGKLIVKSFKVLEATDSVPHLEKLEQEPTRVREPRAKL